MSEPEEPSRTPPELHPRQGPGQQHGHGHDLASLIEAMQRLLHRIGSVLWESRLTDGRDPSGPAPDVAIAERLGQHLERTAQDAGNLWSTVPPEAQAAPSAAPRPTRPSAADAPTPNPGVAPPRRMPPPPAEPRLGEQLQRSTLEHINQALRLARYGDKAGAKLHAGLAESAMKTAAQYLPAEEFQEFHHRVEERLHHLDEAPS